MEGLSDTPAKVTNDNTSFIDMTQDENIPINDNSNFHTNSKTSSPDPKEITSNDHNSSNNTDLSLIHI